MKTCKKCNESKQLDMFCNKSSEPDGKHRYCKSCQKKSNDTWYHENKDNRSQYYQKYREDNKDYFNQYCKHHYHTNKDLYREWHKNRYDNDLIYKIRHTIASRISHSLKTYDTLKSNHTIEYLRCTIEEYTTYLEKQFTPEMSWENYGKYWEIDHIKPVTKFDFNNENELYECFHYSNTQPLNKIENKIKSNKY